MIYGHVNGIYGHAREEIVYCVLPAHYMCYIFLYHLTPYCVWISLPIYSGSEKEHQRSEAAYQCSPCTPTPKQNIYRQSAGKSLEAMGVRIVDWTSNVNSKTRNAATQTQELEDP